MNVINIIGPKLGQLKKNLKIKYSLLLGIQAKEKLIIKARINRSMAGLKEQFKCSINKLNVMVEWPFANKLKYVIIFHLSTLFQCILKTNQIKLQI